MIRLSIVFFSCFTLTLGQILLNSTKCSNYYTCQLELYEQVLNKSRPSLRPVNKDNEKINVRLGFSLIRLVSVNEENSLITIRAHFNQTWVASIFSWNPSVYANVQHFRVPAHSIWTPKIELINPSETLDYEANHFVHIRSNGYCELSYSTLLTSPCNFDIRNFPLDEQNCTFKFGSTLYDINEVSISQAIDFVIDEPSLMPSGYIFLSHSVQQKAVFFAGFERSYDQVSIEINIHRYSRYFMRLINWPSELLLVLTLFVFFISPAAPERITYGAILLLCQFIMLVVFAFHLPKRLGVFLPSMGFLLFFDIFLTTIVLIFSIMIRMLANGKFQVFGQPSKIMRHRVMSVLIKFIGYKRIAFSILVKRDEKYDSTNNDSSAMELLEPVSNSPTTATASDLVASSSSSSTITDRDIASIKRKLDYHTNEYNTDQEWILLAHVFNQFYCLVYIILWAFTMSHHIFWG